jgi:transcriptional regulator with PAS, ATPase and Fis domain
VRDLPRGVQPEGATVAMKAGDDLREALRAYEKAHIHAVLVRCKKDKKDAADRLGVSLSSLYRKIEELGLELSPELKD